MAAEKPVPISAGIFFIFFIGFALLAAAFIFPSAKEAQSHMLYICIFGGCLWGFPPHSESVSLLKIGGSERLDECN
jgi:hypothetical protein